VTCTQNHFYDDKTSQMGSMQTLFLICADFAN